MATWKDEINKYKEKNTLIQCTYCEKIIDTGNVFLLCNKCGTVICIKCYVETGKTECKCGGVIYE